MTVAIDSTSTPGSVGPGGVGPGSVGIVGLGLLGGSVAKATRRWATKHESACRIVGLARSPSTRAWSLEANLVDHATNQIEDLASCDIVVIATPVDRIAQWVIDMAAANPEASITDVGSTKATIVEAVSQDAVATTRFLAAHPIAGGEKSGAQHARADLFDDRPIVLTPSSHENPRVAASIHRFWESLGGRVLSMTPAEHDQRLAASSHVPHLLSSLAARCVDESSLPLVGSGWRDTTRIAAGDADIWSAIIGENRDAITATLKRTRDDLDHLLRAIETHDETEVRSWLADAANIRRSISHRSVSDETKPNS
ncbi:MAG: prephenate dehydrogenase/arogenate dehydrogenase family protein [Planctomycetota bacterium]